MKNILFITALAAGCSSLHAQSLEWVKPMGGRAADRALCVMTDASGNIYTSGHFQDTVDLDPGPGDATSVASSGGSAFVLKMDHNGNLLRALAYGEAAGGHIAAASGMATDAAGNLYVSGYFDGSNVDFDPDTSKYKVTAAGGGNNAYILKLDAGGNFAWVKSWNYNRDAGGNNTRETGPAFTMDATGNLLTAGRFIGDVDFDPGSGVYKFITTVENGYVSKLDANGDFLWARQLIVDTPISNYLFPKSIATDAAGNIYVAGNFSGPADFNPDSTGVYNLAALAPQGFLVKLDASGNFQWVKKMGSDTDPLLAYHTANAVAVTSSGDVYVTGSFMGTADFGGIQLTSVGNSDIYVARLDASGNYKWAFSLGSIYDGEEGSGVRLDPQGDVYVTGTYHGTIDFNRGAGLANLTTNGGSDVFILKLTPDGDYVWAKGYGGDDNSERIQSIALSGTSVYTAGSFFGTVNFDPNGVWSVTGNSTNGNYPDMFLHKMSQFGTGIAPVAGGLQAGLFPNPAHGQFTIDLSGTGAATVSVSVIDIQGRVVVTANVNQEKQIVSVAHLSKGIYFVKIQCGDRSEVKKLLID